MLRIVDNIYNKLIIYIKKVKIGNNSCINGRIHIHGTNGRITIGDNCIITSSADYNSTAGGTHTFLTTLNNGSITVGNNVGMSLTCITSFTKIIIDDNVMIGAGCKIWDTDFHGLLYKERIDGNGIVSLPVHICEGAFIGACSIILKGVTIGKYSVVGAGSVVTHDIPDNEVWAGNPAKFIKRIRN